MTPWASRYDVLNDTTEGEVAVKVYKENQYSVTVSYSEAPVRY